MASGWRSAMTLIVGGILVATDGGSLFGQNSTVSLLQRAAGLGIVAVGQTFAILAGSLDLSVAYVISLTSLIAAETMAGSDGRVAAGDPRRARGFGARSAWSTDC